MRFVADKLDRQCALAVIVQRPVHGAKLSGRAIPQSLTEAFDTRAMLAAHEHGEFLDIAARVAFQIDRRVEQRRQSVEYLGDFHAPVQSARRGAIEQRATAS